MKSFITQHRKYWLRDVFYLLGISCLLLSRVFRHDMFMGIVYGVGFTFMGTFSMLAGYEWKVKQDQEVEMAKKKPSQFMQNFAASYGMRIKRTDPDPVRQLDRKGYVYILKAHDNLYKIGRARDPQNRLRTFEVKLPFPVEFELLIQTEDMYALESQLHRQFAAQRVNGEWFKLTPDDITYLQSLIC